MCPSWPRGWEPYYIVAENAPLCITANLPSQGLLWVIHVIPAIPACPVSPQERTFDQGYLVQQSIWARRTLDDRLIESTVVAVAM